MRAGAPDAMWLWHDGPEPEWHVRTTTARALRRFSGVLWVEEGAFSKVKSSRLELQDRMRPGKREITFDFTTEGSIDGIDFMTPGARCLHVQLLVDGKPDPAQIFLGQKGKHPGKATFSICK